MKNTQHDYLYEAVRTIAVKMMLVIILTFITAMLILGLFDPKTALLSASIALPRILLFFLAVICAIEGTRFAVHKIMEKKAEKAASEWMDSKDEEEKKTETVEEKKSTSEAVKPDAFLMLTKTLEEQKFMKEYEKQLKLHESKSVDELLTEEYETLDKEKVLSSESKARLQAIDKLLEGKTTPEHEAEIRDQYFGRNTSEQ